MDPIASLASLLSLCGISTVRMFAPTFMFGAICRFMPAYSWCPDGVTRLAESCPSFLTSDFGLVVFGVLGVLELVANWDDSVKELISESNIETYVKPVFATLMTYSILTPEQIQVVTAALGDVSNALPAEAASSAVAVTNAVSETVCAAAPEVAESASAEPVSYFSAIVASLFSCGGTFALCKLRASFIETVREMDPENALHLNSMVTALEEGSWIAALPLLLVFPVLALLLMVFLGLFGWMLSRPLRKITEKRRAHWDSVGKEGMLKDVRTRAIVIFTLGVLLSSVPVFGYLVTVIALNLFVFSVLSLYEKRSSRIIARIVMRFIKLTLFLIAIVFSSIPFLGIVMLLPYVVSYVMRVRKIANP